ncbi:MAG: hypothetical protein AAF620_20020 [Bacteroidota bacterium]
MFSKRDKLSLDKYDITKITNILDLKGSSIFEPKSGGAHLREFYLWEEPHHPNMTFLISNYADGLPNLTRFISQKGLIDNIEFVVYENELYRYRKLFKEGRERFVQLIKDARWEFFEEGIPLDYEYVENYEKKNKKDRLNSLMISEYLEAEGIQVDLLRNEISCGKYFQRLAW